MSNSEHVVPGESLFRRLCAREGRRSGVGVSSGFFERFGVGDPWQGPAAAQVGDDNAFFGFLSRSAAGPGLASRRRAASRDGARRRLLDRLAAIEASSTVQRLSARSADVDAAPAGAAFRPSGLGLSDAQLVWLLAAEPDADAAEAGVARPESSRARRGVSAARRGQSSPRTSLVSLRERAPEAARKAASAAAFGGDAGRGARAAGVLRSAPVRSSAGRSAASLERPLDVVGARGQVSASPRSAVALRRALAGSPLLQMLDGADKVEPAAERAARQQAARRPATARAVDQAAPAARASRRQLSPVRGGPADARVASAAPSSGGLASAAPSSGGLASAAHGSRALTARVAARSQVHTGERGGDSAHLAGLIADRGARVSGPAARGGFSVRGLSASPVFRGTAPALELATAAAPASVDVGAVPRALARRASSSTVRAAARASAPVRSDARGRSMQAPSATAHVDERGAAALLRRSLDTSARPLRGIDPIFAEAAAADVSTADAVAADGASRRAGQRGSGAGRARPVGAAPSASRVDAVLRAGDRSLKSSAVSASPRRALGQADDASVRTRFVQPDTDGVYRELVRRISAMGASVQVVSRGAAWAESRADVGAPGSPLVRTLRRVLPSVGTPEADRMARVARPTTPERAEVNLRARRDRDQGAQADNARGEALAARAPASVFGVGDMGLPTEGTASGVVRGLQLGARRGVRRGDARSTGALGRLRAASPDAVGVFAAGEGTVDEAVGTFAEVDAGARALADDKGLVGAIARARSAEELVDAVRREKRGQRSVSGELPAQIAQLIDRIVRAADEAEAESQGAPAVTDPLARTRVSRLSGRSPQHAFFQPPQRAAAGSDDKTLKLASKLRGLIDLAERDRRAAQAEVRMAEDNSSARAEGRGDGSGRPHEPVSITQLQRDVVESVLQELELNMVRNMGDPNGWW